MGAPTVADAASVVEAEGMNGKGVADRVDVPTTAALELVFTSLFPASRAAAGAVTVSGPSVSWSGAVVLASLSEFGHEGTIGGCLGWSTVGAEGDEVAAVATGEAGGSAMPHSTENNDVAKSAKARRQRFAGDGHSGQIQAVGTSRWHRQIQKSRTRFS